MGRDTLTLMGIVPGILHTSHLIPKPSHLFRLHRHFIFQNQPSGSRDRKILAAPLASPT